MKPAIKVFFVSILLMTFFSNLTAAETNYVSDSIKITMRTEPGADRKIIAMLDIGQKVNVLKPGNDWTLVELPDGKNGYVLSRFLTNKVPCGMQLDELKSNYEALKVKASSLLEQNGAFKSNNETLTNDLAATRKEFEALKNDFDKLKADSAHFIELQTKYKQTKSKLEAQTKKAEKAEAEVNKLLWNRNIKWFLGGAGVLLMGFLIGLSTKRQRRRPSLL